MLTEDSIQELSRKIYFIRGHKVMLDTDLTQLYGVETSALNRAVQRNKLRFPPDFMFQLAENEEKNLICQFGISSLGSYGGRRYSPYVFTELGIAMLSSSRRPLHQKEELGFKFLIL